MISLWRTSRWYGQVIGVNDVTCEIGPGLTALLGPNGAGKSTLMKLITGQLRPTTGRTLVFGERPFANTRVFRRIGYCPEIESCYEDMTGREFVRMLGMMAGLTPTVAERRTDEVLGAVRMTEAAHRKIGGYSKGMRQRVKIAQALVHDPEALILDEPLNGLDPVGRREMTALFVELAGAGKCVVVSSHILYEVEQMTRQIILMDRGRLRAMGDVYQIRALIDAHPHRVAIVTPRARDLARRLLEFPYILSAALDGSDDTKLVVETRVPDQFYDDLPRVVFADGYAISEFDSPDNNLEAVFRYLVKG
ncbi:MAG: ABC transporter ATP-binding protein [Armatimonadetes bacterium]|nr:ABC transporter ATP-binding protein [Armatimonadota bacterium]